MVSVNRTLARAVALLLTVNAVAAHGPITPPPQTPPAQSTLKGNEYAIVVSGCVRGNRLKRTGRATESTVADADALKASEFILEGPREPIQQIRREHDGHYDEVTGIAILPPSRNRGDGQVGTKKIGPVQVAVGGRQELGVAAEAPGPVRIRISSLRHVGQTCAARG